MTRNSSLSQKQAEYLDAHLEVFPAEIKKRALFKDSDAVTRSVIRNYQKRKRDQIQPTDSEDLADEIKTYISRHGLPAKFHGKNNVTGFVDWLKQYAYYVLSHK